MTRISKALTMPGMKRSFTCHFALNTVSDPVADNLKLHVDNVDIVGFLNLNAAEFTDTAKGFKFIKITRI